MSNYVVVDTSALLALIQQEKGADQVNALMGKMVMSTVNVTETLGVLQRTQIYSSESLPFVSDILQSMIDFDLIQARITADLELKTKSKGLSLGDRACIALGIHLQAPIYTADKIWAELALEQADIRLIR